MTAPTITIDTLRALNACGDQVALFDATFPEGCVLTTDNLDLAHAAQLDVAWLARRCAASDVLSVLASDVRVDIRGTVALNLNAPPDVLSTLASDARVSVRWFVARNINTPPDVLAKLATDADEDVRWYAIRNVSYVGGAS